MTALSFVTTGFNSAGVGGVKSQARIESLEDGLLHAHADSAEAQHKLYKAGGKLLKELEEENPFAPGVEDLRELLDEMAEDFPKEE